MRKLFSFKSTDTPVYLVVKTKSPGKWLLIDRETGDIFQGNDGGYWDRLDSVIKEENDRN